MERATLLQSIDSYKEQLAQVEVAITSLENDNQREELCDLQSNLKQLIELTEESLNRIPAPAVLEDEFALFMSEMEKDGVVDGNKRECSNVVANELKSLEGIKCRAPHKHQWGDTMYHNAIVCSAVSPDEHRSFEEIEVKIMFINPTHEEMLPCPYLMESDCKFSDDQCKYSHGEIVLFSSLQEYTEPKFDSLTINSLVLAKQSNKLWGRATIKQLFDNKCLVKFDSNHKDLELELHSVVSLDCVEEISDDSDCERDDIINMSLISKPSDEALGHWEKHTKGFGSRIMQKMGYIIGTGLGRFSDGRTEPVTAICLPPGKSLDHCMNLREKSGGDKNLFNVEKKLKRLQRKQEQRNIKAYEREKKKVNVFQFINETLANSDSKESASTSKSHHRLEIRKDTSRSLNVASLQIDENIKRVERDLYKIRESLGRHTAVDSQMHKSLQQKLTFKVNELQMLKAKAVNISSEQKLRSDKRKLTIF